MKIIISPSKTQNLNLNKFENSFKNIYFLDLTKTILDNILQINDDTKFKNYFEIKNDLLLENTKTMYKNYKEFNHYFKAIELYNGLQFKNIEYEMLSSEIQKLIDDNVIILSAFYGLVLPNSYVKPYRLMANSKLKINNTNLYKFWKVHLNQKLSEINNDRIIINLASDEYFKLIDNELFDIYNIEFKIFKNNKFISQSTFSKQCRGIFIKEFAKVNFDLNKIKTLNINGFIFNEKISNNRNFIFTK